jgi:exonuclease III
MREEAEVSQLLSKNAKQEWINARKPEPILGGPLPDHARYMGIKLHFKTKKIVHNFFLVTAYHPHSGKDADIINNFYDSLNQFISQAPQDHHILMGSDTNASLGTAATDEISILGNFGVTTKKNGECEFQLTNLLRLHRLKSMNTCFEHNCYDTHTSNFQGVCLQLDHWFVQDEAQRLVQDAKRWYHGIDSNHAAVLLVLRLPHTILRCKKIKHKK